MGEKKWGERRRGGGRGGGGGGGEERVWVGEGETKGWGLFCGRLNGVASFVVA